ncbi:MAG: transporter [Flavobacteriales bacterium]
MKKILVVLSFISFSFCVNAQEIEPIQTDRPDQTETSHLVPAGVLQFESGWNYERPGDGSSLFVHPTLLWRLGLNGRTELRAITDLTTLKSGNSSSTGLDPVAIGFKVNLLDGGGWMPKTSFIAHLNLPWTASVGRVVDYHYPDFRFTFLNEITDRISLGYNVGAQWNGEDAEPEFLYTFAPAFSISDVLGCYVEAFGFFPENGSANHRVDGGVTWLINNDLQLDVSAGKTIEPAESEAYYVSLGASWRFSIKKK